MKCTLVGFKSVNFTDDDGNRVEGIKIYYSYPDITDEKLDGEVTESKFINRKALESFGMSAKDLHGVLGCIIDLDFNPNKKVVGISLK